MHRTNEGKIDFTLFLLLLQLECMAHVTDTPKIFLPANHVSGHVEIEGTKDGAWWNVNLTESVTASTVTLSTILVDVFLNTFVPCSFLVKYITKFHITCICLKFSNHQNYSEGKVTIFLY